METKTQKPFIPTAKPKLELDALLAKIDTAALDELYKYDVFIVFLSDYYMNTADQKGYNDALFLVWRKDGKLRMKPYNGSCNPSLGLLDAGTKKGTPTLCEDIVHLAYVLDTHKGAKSKGYKALCQRVADVTVTRNNAKGEPYIDKGSFGINLHRGGVKSLNSEGCMTVPPVQFAELMIYLESILGVEQYKLPIGQRTVVPIFITKNNKNVR